MRESNRQPRSLHRLRFALGLIAGLALATACSVYFWSLGALRVCESMFSKFEATSFACTAGKVGAEGHRVSSQEQAEAAIGAFRDLSLLALFAFALAALVAFAYVNTRLKRNGASQ